MSDGSVVSDAPEEGVFDVRPAQPQWTHIALRVLDVEVSIEWYTTFTPLEVLARHQDDLGFGVWLGMPEKVENPFVLVLSQFLPATDPFADDPPVVLAPFAHLGIEVPTHDQIDQIADRARGVGCLAMEPREMGPPVGYICMLSDPDGNRIEYSFDQGVYATAREVWGS